MTKLAGEWLSKPAVQTMFAIFNNAGFQIYAVGGCVRNAILNMPIADIDFATDALPDQVIELATNNGLRAVPTGIEHGTVTLVSGQVGFEVTTFRKDVETDGRRAVIAFANSLEQDAHRRDFTMNALYLSAGGEISDPLGGLADLELRRVRFIDSPSGRIREDYLRILRFFRFHAWFGDPDAGIDAEALAACAELAEGVEALSKERVGAEIRKLLSAPDPAPSISAMRAIGLLARILPGANPAFLPVLVHNESIIGVPPDWIRRLAILGGESHQTLLRMSKADGKKLACYWHVVSDAQQTAELAYRHGVDTAVDIELLRSASGGTTPTPDIRQIALNAERKNFPIRAADLPSSLKGAAIGDRLKALENMWIASDFRQSKDELLDS